MMHHRLRDLRDIYANSTEALKKISNDAKEALAKPQGKT